MKFQEQLLKRVYKFFLKRAIGNFLKDELDLHQLDVQLGEGLIVLKDLHLNTDVFNEEFFGESVDDLRLVSGHISRVRAVIPWTNLLQGTTEVEIAGMTLCFGSHEDMEESNAAFHNTQMGSSLFDLRRVSKQQPQDTDEAITSFLPTQAADSEADGINKPNLPGLRGLARVIEAILARVRLTITNFTVVLIHPEVHPFSNQNFRTTPAKLLHERASLVLTVSSVDASGDTVEENLGDQSALNHTNSTQHGDVESDEIVPRVLRKDVSIFGVSVRLIDADECATLVCIRQDTVSLDELGDADSNASSDSNNDAANQKNQATNSDGKVDGWVILSPMTSLQPTTISATLRPVGSQQKSSALPWVEAQCTLAPHTIRILPVHISALCGLMSALALVSPPQHMQPTHEGRGTRLLTSELGVVESVLLTQPHSHNQIQQPLPPAQPQPRRNLRTVVQVQCNALCLVLDPTSAVSPTRWLPTQVTPDAIACKLGHLRLDMDLINAAGEVKLRVETVDICESEHLDDHPSSMSTWRRPCPAMKPLVCVPHEDDTTDMEWVFVRVIGVGDPVPLASCHKGAPVSNQPTRQSAVTLSFKLAAAEGGVATVSRPSSSPHAAFESVGLDQESHPPSQQQHFVSHHNQNTVLINVSPVNAVVEPKTLSKIIPFLEATQKTDSKPRTGKRRQNMSTGAHHTTQPSNNHDNIDEIITRLKSMRTNDPSSANAVTNQTSGAATVTGASTTPATHTPRGAQPQNPMTILLEVSDLKVGLLVPSVGEKVGGMIRIHATGLTVNSDAHGTSGAGDSPSTSRFSQPIPVARNHPQPTTCGFPQSSMGLNIECTCLRVEIVDSPHSKGQCVLAARASPLMPNSRPSFFISSLLPHNLRPSPQHFPSDKSAEAFVSAPTSEPQSWKPEDNSSAHSTPLRHSSRMFDTSEFVDGIHNLGDRHADADLEDMQFREAVLASSLLRVNAAVPVLVCGMNKQTFDSAAVMFDLAVAAYSNLKPFAKVGHCLNGPTPTEPDVPSPQHPQPPMKQSIVIPPPQPLSGTPEQTNQPKADSDSDSDSENVTFYSVHPAQSTTRSVVRSTHHSSANMGSMFGASATSSGAGNTIYYSLCGWGSDKDEDRPTQQPQVRSEQQHDSPTATNFPLQHSPFCIVLFVSHFQLAVHHSTEAALHTHSHVLNADDATLFAVPSFCGSASSFSSLHFREFSLLESSPQAHTPPISDKTTNFLPLASNVVSSLRTLIAPSPLRNSHHAHMLFLATRNFQTTETPVNEVSVSFRSAHIMTSAFDDWAAQIGDFFTPPTFPNIQVEDTDLPPSPPDAKQGSTDVLVAMNNLLVEILPQDGKSELSRVAVGVSDLAVLISSQPCVAEYVIELRDTQAFISNGGMQSKLTPDPSASDIQTLLEAHQYVRVALMDWLRIRVRNLLPQDEAPQDHQIDTGNLAVSRYGVALQLGAHPAQTIHVTNQKLLVLTCSDSFHALVRVLSETTPASSPPSTRSPSPTPTSASTSTSAITINTVHQNGAPSPFGTDVLSGIEDNAMIPKPTQTPASAPIAQNTVSHTNLIASVKDNYIEHVMAAQTTTSSAARNQNGAPNANKQHPPKKETPQTHEGAFWYEDDSDSTTNPNASAPMNTSTTSTVSVSVLDDHFKAPTASMYTAPSTTSRLPRMSLPSAFPTPSSQISLHNFSVHWRMFGGSDFEAAVSRNNNSRKSTRPQSGSSTSTSTTNVQATNVCSTTPHTMYLGETVGGSSKRYRSGRRDGEMVEVRVDNLCVGVSLFDAEERPQTNAGLDGIIVWRVDARLQTLEIVDGLPSSSWNKFMCALPPSSTHRHASSGPMFSILVDAILPDSRSENQELRVTTRVVPLRFHIDQDAVEFLLLFLTPPTSTPSPQTQQQQQQPQPQPQTQPQQQAHSPQLQSQLLQQFPQAPQQTSQQTLQQQQQQQQQQIVPGLSQLDAAPTQQGFFIQSFSINQLLFIVDYKPKRLDLSRLRSGQYEEALNFVGVEGVEVRLSPVVVRGAHSLDKLLEMLGERWLPELMRLQAWRYVTGIPPVRSLVRLGSQMKSLMVGPLCGLQRGLQRGTLFNGVWYNPEQTRYVSARAKNFVWTLAIETIDLTTKLAGRTQALLEHADTALTRMYQTENPHTLGSAAAARNRSRLASQPQNTRDGFQQAYESLSRGLQAAAHTLYTAPSDEFRRGGTGAYVKSVAKAVPVAVLQPAIGATEAVSKALLGVRHEVDPQKLRAMEDKYKQ